MHADLGVNLGAATKVTYTGWYASGDDDASATDDEINNFIATDVDTFDSVIFFEGGYTDDNYFTEAPYFLTAGAIFNKLAVEHKVTPKLTAGAAVMYVMTAEDLTIGSGDTSENLGTEIDGSLSYKINPNLELAINAGYLVADDEMDAFEVNKEREGGPRTSSARPPASVTSSCPAHAGLAGAPWWPLGAPARCVGAARRAARSVVEDLREEELRPLRARPAEELVLPRVLDDLALIHEDDPVRDLPAKPISWVTHHHGHALLRERTITSSTSLIISGSSAEVGSSNSMQIGSMASARAMATRCCCPPESCPGNLGACARSPPARGARPRSVALSSPAPEHLHLRDGEVLDDRHVREQLEVLEHHPTRARSLGRSVRRSPTEVPSTTISPCWNVSRPFTHLMRWTSPSRTARRRRSPRPSRPGRAVLQGLEAVP